MNYLGQPHLLFMQRKVIYTLLLTVLICACENNAPPQEFQELIERNNSFWDSRSTLKNNTLQEKIFPTPDRSISIVEQRTNRLYINSMQCQYEVFINDVMLRKFTGPSTKNGSGVTGDYDINQLMLTSGSHEIKVRIYPRYGLKAFPKEEGQMKLVLSHLIDRNLNTVKYSPELKGHNGVIISQSDKQWVSKYNEEFQEEYDGEYQAKFPNKFEGLPVYEWRSTFQAQVPFDLTGWRASVNLKEEYDNNAGSVIQELTQQYEHLYALIKNKNVDQYLNLVKEREALITSSLLYKRSDEPLRQQELIRLIRSDEYELQPLLKETFKLEFQAYGNLVMLLHKADGEGVIRLKNKNNSKDIIFIDLRFHRKKAREPLTII